MSENQETVYRYRRWPFLLPVYAVFAFLYYFLIYWGESFVYVRFAETLVMSLFILSPLAPCYFDLKIRKISSFSILAKSLFFSFLFSGILILVLMFTYLEGEAWFGAIALLFFYLAYNIIFFPFAYIFFRVSRRQKRLDYA